MAAGAFEPERAADFLFGDANRLTMNFGVARGERRAANTATLTKP